MLARVGATRPSVSSANLASSHSPSQANASYARRDRGGHTAAQAAVAARPVRIEPIAITAIAARTGCPWPAMTDSWVPATSAITPASMAVLKPSPDGPRAARPAALHARAVGSTAATASEGPARYRRWKRISETPTAMPTSAAVNGGGATRGSSPPGGGGEIGGGAPGGG